MRRIATRSPDMTPTALQTDGCRDNALINDWHAVTPAIDIVPGKFCP
jgi:hypothetical protein